MKRSAARLGIVALVGVIVGSCGGDSTGPGAAPTMSVAVSDRAGSTLAQRLAGAMGSPEAVPTSFSGTFSGTARAYAYSSADGWVEVGSPAAVTFDVQGTSETTLVTAVDVPEGTYTRLRLSLSAFNLHLNAGAVIGGITFDSAVDIAVGGADSAVDLEITVPSVSLSAGSSATAHFELNSEAWVNQAVAEAGSVDDADVQAAATASITGG